MDVVLIVVLGFVCFTELLLVAGVVVGCRFLFVLWLCFFVVVVNSVVVVISFCFVVNCFLGGLFCWFGGCVEFLDCDFCLFGCCGVCW